MSYFRDSLARLTAALDNMPEADRELVESRLGASIVLGATLEDADPTLACVLYHIGEGANAANVICAMGLLDE